jgi:hypothetical protein
MNKYELPFTNKTHYEIIENYTKHEAKNTKTRNILLWFKIQYTLHIKQKCDRYKIITSRFGINTSELISKVCSSLDHHSLVELLNKRLEARLIVNIL